MRLLIRLLCLAWPLLAGTWCLGIAPNLLPNGSLDAGLTGWTALDHAALDAAQTKDGTPALKLTFTPGKSAGATTPRAPVEAGTDYLLLLWFRSEGGSRPGKSDVSTYYTPIWYDANGTALTPRDGNLPMPYDARAAWTCWPRLWTAPPNAVAVALQFHLYGAADSPATALWIDHISLRRHDGAVKPGGKRWQFYIPDNWFSGNFRVAADDAAFQGSAVMANPKYTTTAGYLGGNIYQKGLPPGQYRALFHLKIADLAATKPVIVIDTNSEKHGGVNGRAIMPAEFATAGVYQDIALRFIVTPQTGWVDWRAYWTGVTGAALDTITVVEEEIYREDTIRALFQ